MGGFASTTWFMTLGVSGLGAAITGCGLFYRLSLHLVRLFPLSYHWQIIATGIMGVVVMALIPQQTARTVITSQMLINLSESLGYKTPSKASTGLIRRELSRPGPTGISILDRLHHQLDRLGLVADRCARAIHLGLLVFGRAAADFGCHRHHLAVTIFLYRPETQSKISYKMVQTQLDILGPLSHKEWISLAVLLFTVGGWLPRPTMASTAPGSPSSPSAVLVNTGDPRLGHDAQGHRLGIVNSHGRDLKHADAC